MPEEVKKGHNIFLYLLLTCCFVAIATSFYFFYYKKAYDFIVEVACNPTQEECFHRDCSIDGNCPSNNLSDFKRYSLSANDFKMCENEDCTYSCENNVIPCEQVACTEDDSVGETCVSMPQEQSVPVEQNDTTQQTEPLNNQ